MKTTLLERRGVYVRKANRTRASIFIIMLAYVLAYELQQRWRDFEEGIQELASMCTVELTLVGQARCQIIPDPRPLGQHLLERLNITLPDALPRRGITVATRKDLTARRNNPLLNGLSQFKRSLRVEHPLRGAISTLD